MDNILEQYKGKIVKESLIKSLIIGGIAGFAVIAIISIISFVTKENLLLLAVILGVVTTVITTIVLFKTLYKTSINVIARRVDNLGLEERLITMLEYQDDDSVMASIQRDDTKVVLEKVEPASLKMKFVKWPIIACAIAFLLSTNLVVGSTVVAVKEANKEPEQVLPEEIVDPYKDQIDDMVQAIRDEIDEFQEWYNKPWAYEYLHTIVDDMVKDDIKYDMMDYNSRSTRVIETHALITYLIPFFLYPAEEEEEDGDGPSESDKDYVIDGETEYEFVFPESYEEALDMVQNGNLPDEFKELIMKYFGILDPNVNEE